MGQLSSRKRKLESEKDESNKNLLFRVYENSEKSELSFANIK